jgi:hypothetical protein
MPELWLRRLAWRCIERRRRRERILKLQQGTLPPEGGEAVSSDLGRFVPVALKRFKDAYDLVKQHLQICGECREEFALLLKALERLMESQKRLARPLATVTIGADFSVVCASPIGNSRDRWAMHATNNSRLEFSLQG